MELIECTIRASWPHRILFTDHVFDPANPALRHAIGGKEPEAAQRVLVVVDRGVVNLQPALLQGIAAYFAAHPGALSLVCAPLVRPGGEEAKSSWSNVAEIHAAIDEHHIDRHSYVVAVGGGALLDMVGLAAATAHRGVRHVRIPTTTLSQCDSGVGVKNGINAFGKKNFIGTFSPPFAVVNDLQFLRWLPPRDRRGGYAEAVKVACVRDRAFFDELERDAGRLRDFEEAALRRTVIRCAQLHLDHIATSGHPFESTLGRPLDFGHWSAHKLEQLSQFRLRHAEAVAIGLALDVIYSRRAGFLAEREAERILQVLEALGFALFTPEMLSVGPRQERLLLGGLEEFREHLGGRLAITLLKSIGAGFEVQEMNNAWVLESIGELHARASAAAQGQ